MTAVLEKQFIFARMLYDEGERCEGAVWLYVGVWVVTNLCDFGPKLRQSALHASLNKWLEVLGEKRFVTFVPGSVAARLVDPTFTDSLNKCNQRQSLEAQYVRARLQEYSNRCTSPTVFNCCVQPWRPRLECLEWQARGAVYEYSWTSCHSLPPAKHKRILKVTHGVPAVGQRIECLKWRQMNMNT